MPPDARLFAAVSGICGRWWLGRPGLVASRGFAFEIYILVYSLFGLGAQLQMGLASASAAGIRLAATL